MKVASADHEAKVRVTGDASGAVNEMRRMDRQVLTSAREVRKFAGALRTLGVLAAVKVTADLARRQVDLGVALTRTRNLLGLSDEEFGRLASSMTELRDRLAANDIEQGIFGAILLDNARNIAQLEGDIGSAEKITRVLEAAWNLTHATGQDFGETVSGLVDVMRAYRTPAQQAASVSDKLFGALRASTEDVDAITASVAALAPAALAAKVSLDEVLATVAAVGTEAQEGIGLVLSLMVSAAEGDEKAKGLIERLDAVRSTSDASPLLGMFNALKVALDGGVIDASELKTALGDLVTEDALADLDGIIAKLEEIHRLKGLLDTADVPETPQITEEERAGMTSEQARRHIEDRTVLPPQRTGEAAPLAGAAEEAAGSVGRTIPEKFQRALEIRQAQERAEALELYEQRLAEAQQNAASGIVKDRDRFLLDDPEGVKETAERRADRKAKAKAVKDTFFQVGGDVVRSLVVSLKGVKPPGATAEGGVVTSDQVRRVGEGGEAEVIAPVSKLNEATGEKLGAVGWARKIGLRMFARGGRVTRPETIVAGERGPETVVPETREGVRRLVPGLIRRVFGRAPVPVPPGEGDSSPGTVASRPRLGIGDWRVPAKGGVPDREPADRAHAPGRPVVERPPRAVAPIEQESSVPATVEPGGPPPGPSAPRLGIRDWRVPSLGGVPDRPRRGLVERVRDRVRELVRARAGPPPAPPAEPSIPPAGGVVSARPPPASRPISGPVRAPTRSPEPAPPPASTPRLGIGDWRVLAKGGVPDRPSRAPVPISDELVRFAGLRGFHELRERIAMPALVTPPSSSPLGISPAAPAVVSGEPVLAEEKARRRAALVSAVQSSGDAVRAIEQSQARGRDIGPRLGVGDWSKPPGRGNVHVSVGDVTVNLPNASPREARAAANTFVDELKRRARREEWESMYGRQGSRRGDP